MPDPSAGHARRRLRGTPADRRPRRVFRSAVSLLATSALCLSCQPTSGGETPDAQDRPFVVAAPPAGPALVFPPAPQSKPRGPSPAELTGDTEPASDVDWPYLDDDGAFTLSGRNLSVSFARQVVVPKTAEGSIIIDPPVAGKTSWNSEWSVQFVADDHFDPDQVYRLTLGALKDTDGDPVAEGYKATFKARPAIDIAGKVINYFPEPGKPRLVTVRPYDGARVAQGGVVSALFDQKVDLSTLAGRVTVTVDGVAASPVLGHPKKGEYEGVEVDAAHVVKIRPASKPKAGASVVVSIAALDPADGAETVSLEIARPLAFDAVGCGWGGDSSCVLKGGELHLPGRDFTVTLNNPIDMDEKQLAKAIAITPKVRNLSIWSDRWSASGRIHISGDFKSSKTYHVAIGALKDRFGSKVRKTVSFDIVRPSQAASVAMAEGVQFVDAKGSRAFEIDTRNVSKAKLALWEIPPTASGHQDATSRLSSRDKPSRTPDVVIPIAPRARRDAPVTTKLNLLDHLTPGKSYLAMLELDKVAFGAPPPTYPSWSMAARAPTALITPNNDEAVVMHAHASGNEILVFVSRLANGKPLSGATVSIDGDASKTATTDADGVAVLTDSATIGRTVLLSATHGSDTTRLALGNGSLTAGHLAPELTSGAGAKPIRGIIITDRGAYRPGATVRIKAALRKRDGGRLRPLAEHPLRLRVVDPTGKEALSTTATTNDMGGLAVDFPVSARASIGRYRIIVGPEEGTEQYTQQTIQVAEFEPPRFSVDVQVEREADDRVKANITGKYLFGAAMDQAPVNWTLRRSDAAIPSGTFTARGLRFRAQRYWYDEASHDDWSRSGTGELSGSGTLQLRQVISMPDDRGPQRFTLEAEVTDASHRAIAGRGGVVMHPATHYAGIKVSDRWLDTGDAVPFEVGVVDQQGKPAPGKMIRVELSRQRWVRTRKSGPGGSYRTDWHVERDTIDTCTVKSSTTVGTCDLSTKASGDYRVTAYVDGKPGGSEHLWVWGSDWDSGSPSKGRTLQVSTDKTQYRPGDTAKLVVVSPFKKATALVTVEDGGMSHRRAETVTGRAATFEIKIPEDVDGPWVHATVTLLPRGAKGAAAADWKLGAVRIPLALDDVRLQVQAKSDRQAYEPGDHVQLDIDVTRGGKAAANAEVVLAVVDEGVLRLTNHHAPDPVDAMHPGRPLLIKVDDNRRAFADLLARSHTAGGGPGSGAQSLVGARKKFVRTALWKPDLRTDASGHIDVDFDLPDNLTRFRIMAVALDSEGRGGSVEDGFFVRKALMAQPAVPRFATVGDRFEAAVMVHNNESTEQEVTVVLGKREKKATIAANGRARVSFAIHPARAGTRTLVFSVRDGEGTERDKVVAKIPVAAPGLDERPVLAGAFVGSQRVRLEIPDEVSAGRGGDEFVTVTVGEQLWPELASRLEYLVDYPHGCVEQTTSSTVPLLAAREMLPQLGVTRWSQAQIDDMIVAGVERLDSMRTSSGGLAYWPGGHEPNVYGTAYAMNAIVGAKRAGIKLPDGLLEGMRDYLATNLDSDHLPWGTGPEVRAAIALSLAEADGLPAQTADRLFDTKDKQGPFGLGALAISLSTLPDEDSRVSEVIDLLEARLDDDGTVLGERPEHEFYYFGSTTRSQAMAAIALGRLRPDSKKLPGLVHELLQAPEGYTTQSTAYALLSLTEHLSRQPQDPMEGRVRALLDGVSVEALLGDAKPLGPRAMQYQIPLSRLRGHSVQLELQAESEAPIGFAVSARWRRDLKSPQARVATTGAHAPDMFRVVTDVDGNPVDLSKVEAGSTLRVVLLARLPRGRVADERMGYLALTDRLPAGFEALQPDLWTVASVPQLSDKHPLYNAMRWGSEASHVELRDDRALFYFDRVWGDTVHATYLMRATTPGTFAAAPASADLMYETDGIGYSEGLVYGVKR